MRKFQTLIIGAISSALVLAVAGWGVWALLALVPANAARAWALLATLAVPLAIYITWRVATVEVRAQLKGIERGVGTVTQAAEEITRVRVSAQQQPRMPLIIPPPSLPQIETRYSLVERHTDIIDV